MAAAAMEADAPTPCVIGIALKVEKFAKHISSHLIELAAQQGIALKQLDVEQPLEEQGPLHAILQKIRTPEWERRLEAYAAAHPEVQVLDMPAATYPLRHRGTMLAMVDRQGWVFQDPGSQLQQQLQQQQGLADAAARQQRRAQEQPGSPSPRRCRCSVPLNVTLAEGVSYAAAVRAVACEGMVMPLVAKPLWADGREGSHALAVVNTAEGLRQLVEGPRPPCGFGPPCLLEQYVDHGGCLFKVYVLADRALRVKRSSLDLPQSIVAPGLEPLRQPAALLALAEDEEGAMEGAEARPAPMQQDGQPPLLAVAAGGAAAEGAAAATGPATAAVPLLPAAAAAPVASEGGQLLGSSPPAGGGAAEAWDPVPDLEFVDRVSAYPRAKSWGKADLAPKGHGVPSPPAWFIEQLAQRLRQHLGLSLFNFDLIVPMQQVRRRRLAAAADAANCGDADAVGEQHKAAEKLYHLIDINYFPGYEKLPDYESHMVAFLCGVKAEASRRLLACAAAAGGTNGSGG